MRETGTGRGGKTVRERDRQTDSEREGDRETGRQTERRTALSSSQRYKFQWETHRKQEEPESTEFHKIKKTLNCMILETEGKIQK